MSVLLKTKGKFGNVRHTPFTAEPQGTKKDMIQDKQIKNLKKKVKKIELDEEVKWVDVGASALAVPEAGVNLASGGIAFLVTQAAVANENSRIGDSITTTSLLFRAQIYSALTDIQFGAPVRIIVFWDKQANGAVASISGTQNSLMQASGSVLGQLDHRNQKTIDRFDIIWDKTFNITPRTVHTVVAGVTTELTQTSLYISKRFKLGRKIRYTGNAGAITDIAGNNICVCAISSGATPVEPNINYNMRLYFKDD